MITVITTIAEPTACVETLISKIGDTHGLIVIGDKKGPFSYGTDNTQFYSLEDQFDLDFELAHKLPMGHYSRKNLGYLLAIRQGEKCIYETDDDNRPNAHWKVRSKEVKALRAERADWINAYGHFSRENIWPRGFLLDRISDPSSRPRHDGRTKTLSAPIQQGLADVAPDVDAIWRLTQNREFSFDRAESLALPKGAWCPFNTQSTRWWEEAFPLLYLPSHCSVRMTDIWESFVAHRCLWEMGHELVFHAPEVEQDRNVHNLMKDFQAEVPGYLINEKLTSILEGTKLLSGAGNALENLLRCYESLVEHKIFPQKEMDLVQAWAADVLKPSHQKAEL